MAEELFIKLRYCFMAGYTLPQYCVEHDIKKPLFVIERSARCFLLEVHAQFCYDKRISLHQFCFIDDDKESTRISLNQRILGMSILVKHISDKCIEWFDAVIFLTQKKYDLGMRASRSITFFELENFFIQRAYVDIPILHFLQRFPKVKFFLTNFPSDLKRYKGGTKFREQLPAANHLQRTLTQNKDKHIETPFDKLGYTNEEVIELLRIDKAKVNLDGTTVLVDNDNPLKQIINGKRVTAYQPEHYLNKIYFFGPCHHYGINAPFDKTIESYLQKMLNEANLPYRVENESQHFAERYQDIFYNLNKINPAPGDIIFFWIANLKSNNDSIPFCDVSDVFDPPIDFKEIFCRKNHINELGYKLLAEKYFKFLTENNFFRDVEFKYPSPSQPYRNMRRESPLL